MNEHLSKHLSKEGATAPERLVKIEDLVTRGVYEVIGGDEIVSRLKNGENLRVKFGTDPTSPHIHTGRMVPLLKLRDFQELGCTPVIVIGDFTGEIGDTSDKESERPMLDTEVVRKNLTTYIEQVGKIINLDSAEIYYNSSWLSKLNFAEIGFLANTFSLAEFISRSNIRTRLDKGSRVSLREVLYPLMQGYDSVVVRADVELGGDDQRFNLLAGRQLQKAYGQPMQNILMTHLISGIDGRKMSSSWGNTINLTDNPNDFFGKVMSMKDECMIESYIHCTRVPMALINEYEQSLEMHTTNPMNVKLNLAFEMTKLVHGEVAANQAHQFFQKTVQNKSMPGEIPEFQTTEKSIIELLILCGYASSKGDARRLITSGGVSVDGQKVESDNFQVQPGSIIRKGKRNYTRIIK